MSSQGQDTFRQVTSIIQQLSPVNIAAVREHVMELLTSPTTSLKPKSGTSYDNHGNESQVMILDGTVPITYMGGRYNIPIEMYIGKRYPEVAPSVYVRPSPTMRVKQDHDSVAVDGSVYIHMLTNWRSNNRLMELYQMLSSVFSANPPLFSAPTSTPPPPPVVAHGSTVPASSSADPPSSEKIVKLQTMMQATEETEQTCLFYLEMMGWDLPSAMEEYRQTAATGKEKEKEKAQRSVSEAEQAAPDKQRYYVEIPRGVKPGQHFHVMVNEQQMMVKCPENLKPGDRIIVTPPSQQESSQQYVVTVPDNIRPGQQFRVIINSQDIMVTCPPNVGPTQRVTFQLPRQSAQPKRESAPNHQMFEVTVPDGVTPGTPFALIANGQRVMVTCPPNVGPGKKIRFELPVSLSETELNSLKVAYDKDGWMRCLGQDLKYHWHLFTTKVIATDEDYTLCYFHLILHPILGN